MPTVPLLRRRRARLPRRPRPAYGDLRWDGTAWRRWSGRRWAPAVYSMQPGLLTGAPGPETWPRPTGERLAHGLALAVERQVTENAATVDHEGPHGVVLAYRRRVAHVLHAVLTLLTGGLWALVWIAVVVGRRHDRIRLEIDDWGHVWVSRLPPR